MENNLINLVKQMKGITLGIGITSEKIKEAIEKNDNIRTCYLLEEPNSTFNKKRFNFNSKLKKVNIKKIRKVFKKKRIENLICNYKTIKPFLKTFIKDSVYINKGKLYIYGTENDLEPLIDKYKRYTDKIEIKNKKEEFLIIIDNIETKNNKIKDIGYWWKDTIDNIVDFLTSFLVN